MDQVKKALEVALKHQFWIITGLATLVGCLAWFMINSSLNKLYAENEKLIKDKVSAMGQVQGAVATHPNDFSKTEMEKIIQTLGTDVEEAWNEQFKRQEQFLQWREEAIQLPALIGKLKNYYPIELKLTYPDEPKNITDEEKRRFSQYFAEQMPELAKIIGVTWLGVASETAAAGGGGAPGAWAVAWVVVAAEEEWAAWEWVAEWVAWPAEKAVMAVAKVLVILPQTLLPASTTLLYGQNQAKIS